MKSNFETHLLVSPLSSPAATYLQHSTNSEAKEITAVVEENGSKPKDRKKRRRRLPAW